MMMKPKFSIFILERVNPRNVVANMLDCDIVVSEIELQSRFYLLFWTNTFLGKI